MQGYVAVTDIGWYRHLSREPGPRDANFWRPSSRACRLETGTPFLFKLKAPHNAVVGFGYFAGFTILPDWLAWETFGEANGVTGPEELHKRLARIRRGAGIQADPAGRIGCCMIAEAIFFQPDEWIPQPHDWRGSIQTGTRYDLSAGEGLRVWGACLDRASGLPVASRATEEKAPRFGAPVLRAPRLGQGIFRVKVLDAYGRACAVTGEHSLPVLEAAHIKPYASGGEHRVANGLSLRSDLHRLFDRGYVTIDPEHRFVVSDRLRQDFENGRSYYGLHGRKLLLPRESASRPDPSALEWHRSEAYLG